MARERDLPAPLARVGGRHTVPFVAELAVAAVVILLLLTTDVMTVVGFSSFGVLIYYAVTNAAAFTLDVHPAHAPKWLNAAGFARLPAAGLHAAAGLRAGDGRRPGRRCRSPVSGSGCGAAHLPSPPSWGTWPLSPEPGQRRRVRVEVPR